MDAVKTGIVGYGYAGKVFHARLVQAADGLDLCAVATRDPGRRADAATLGVSTCATVDELLQNQDVQLVILATPHDTHADLAVRCLDAGRHVVTDKIMCLSTAEADAMIAASRRNRRMLSVFHNRRWDGDYLTVRKAIEDGLIGDLLVVESSVVSFRNPTPERWRSHRKHGGGTFRDWGAHLFDQACQMMESPLVSVYADMLYTAPSVDIETSARCFMTFENGARCVVETGFISHLPRPRWYVRGSEGALINEGLDPQEAALRDGVVSATLERPPDQRVRLFRQSGGKTEELELETLSGNWPAYYQNVADHLLKGAELAVKPEQVRRSIAVIEAAARSAETGETVRTNI